MKILKYSIFLIIGLTIGIYISGKYYSWNYATLPHDDIISNFSSSKGEENGSSKKLINMKIYQQETDYSCGGSALKTLLGYYGILNGRSETQINNKLGTSFDPTKPGTHPDQMIDFLKSEGLAVISGENGSMPMIYHYLDQNIPIIVLDSSWGGHWRMVIGYDFNGDYNKWENNDLYFADPEHNTIEPITNSRTGVLMENESRFYYEWYENRLFDQPYNQFYIVAYPKNMVVDKFVEKEEHTK